MRSVPLSTQATFLLAGCMFVAIPNSFAIDEKIPDAGALAALESKAQAAAAKDQCFLYAELVHQMTELAGRQMIAGNDARATLNAVHEYAQKIHVSVAEDSKKLKGAQILMEHTAFRLNEILHSAASEDRPVLEATLKQLNQVQNELMMQVFRH